VGVEEEHRLLQPVGGVVAVARAVARAVVQVLDEHRGGEGEHDGDAEEVLVRIRVRVRVRVRVS